MFFNEISDVSKNTIRIRFSNDKTFEFRALSFRSDLMMRIVAAMRGDRRG